MGSRFCAGRPCPGELVCPPARHSVSAGHHYSRLCLRLRRTQYACLAVRVKPATTMATRGRRGSHQLTLAVTIDTLSSGQDQTCWRRRGRVACEEVARPRVLRM